MTFDEAQRREAMAWWNLQCAMVNAAPRERAAAARAMAEASRVTFEIWRTGDVGSGAVRAETPAKGDGDGER